MNLKINVNEIINDPDNLFSNPKHYKLGDLDIEVIDIIHTLMTPDEFRGYCYGNLIKYVLRQKNKNGIEDLIKARVYLNWLIGFYNVKTEVKNER